jgi:hypothetical protein
VTLAIEGARIDPRELRGSREDRRDIEGRQLLGRAATLEDVGNAAVFAASDFARGMGGGILNVGYGELVDQRIRERALPLASDRLDRQPDTRLGRAAVSAMRCVGRGWQGTGVPSEALGRPQDGRCSPPAAAAPGGRATAAACLRRSRPLSRSRSQGTEERASTSVSSTVVSTETAERAAAAAPCVAASCRRLARRRA